MEPLISVIVPVYNGQDYLENCIKSILGQSYPYKEIILINDGSTDRTGEICEALAQEYDDVYVITMNDEGVSAARNAGMDKASGSYFMFLDADDRLHPEMIETLYDALVRTSSDVAGCGFFLWSSEEEWEQGIRENGLSAKKPSILLRDGLLEQIADGKDTRCWAKLYKRTAVENIRFRQGLTIGEDMLFLLDVLAGIRKMAVIDFPGYGYYQNPAGAMNRKFTSAYMDQIICWETARELAVQMDCSMRVKVTERLLMAIMLVAGKLAFLPAAERKAQKEHIQTCVQKLRENLQVKGAYEGLSKGYKIKVKLFISAPSFYLWLYHFRKYVK